jgi:hypothetical protein
MAPFDKKLKASSSLLSPQMLQVFITIGLIFADEVVMFSFDVEAITLI